MTATEAKNLADSKQDDKTRRINEEVAKKLSGILYEIEKTAAKGHYSITYEFKVSDIRVLADIKDLVVRQLKGEGYNVSVLATTLSIFWN